MDSKQIMEALQAPFPPEDIEWRVGSTTKDKKKGLALGYVTNRAIQNRLDEVFGPFGWQNQFREWKGTSQICGISVKFEGEWITKWDGADDSATEAVKGGLSDSMKRAAYQWGIGRYLYKLPQVWVPLKQAGSSYVLASKPQLPEWAIPKGCKQDEQTEPEHPDDEHKLSVEQLGEILASVDYLLTFGGTKERVLSKLEESIGYSGPLETITVDFYNNIVNKLNAWIKAKEKAAQEQKLMEDYGAEIVDETKGA